MSLKLSKLNGVHSLRFYGLTKRFGNSRIYDDFKNCRVREFSFYNTLWKDKLFYLTWLLVELKSLHKLEFEKGTHEIYKKLSCKYMDDNSNQRPTASHFGEADKEMPNISTLYDKNLDAIYTSRTFTFNNLTNPVNSFIITSYLDDDETIEIFKIFNYLI
ncbi:kinase-like domain-containing protein [Rhizophagus clarus]|uniref:Kinase-like domain-containing protein n=1 Tax=Rhizophagus clarus TaxID=94130 RepID=A0A8H3KUB2_9GLOM|nr:kinase-like domain-containing protein [Rhizophagus clarus]